MAPPDAPHEAELVFAYPTAERARLVARSVGREVGEIEGDRTRAAVGRDGSRVAVRVGADDLVALRAGLNTWGSLVEVAERAAAVGDDGEHADGSERTDGDEDGDGNGDGAAESGPDPRTPRD